MTKVLTLYPHRPKISTVLHRPKNCTDHNLWWMLKLSIYPHPSKHHPLITWARRPHWARVWRKGERRGEWASDLPLPAFVPGDDILTMMMVTLVMMVVEGWWCWWWCWGWWRRHLIVRKKRSVAHRSWVDSPGCPKGERDHQANNNNSNKNQ